jgi:hypothetical protein
MDHRETYYELYYDNFVSLTSGSLDSLLEDATNLNWYPDPRLVTIFEVQVKEKQIDTFKSKRVEIYV